MIRLVLTAVTALAHAMIGWNGPVGLTCRVGGHFPNTQKIDGTFRWPRRRGNGALPPRTMFRCTQVIAGKDLSGALAAILLQNSKSKYGFTQKTPKGKNQ
jgi:hypothetical protein